MNAQPQHGSDVDALRRQFAEKHQMVLRSFFSTEECEDIMEWVDFGTAGSATASATRTPTRFSLE